MKLRFEDIQQLTKQVWIWMLKKDAFIFLLFVALSALFWWGHATSSVRDGEVKLPVVYTNIPEEVFFETPLPEQIEITIRDNGRLLRQVKHSHPTLTINMAEKLTPSGHRLHLSAETLRPKLQDILPGSTIIQQIRPESIEAQYSFQTKKVVPIQLRAKCTLAEQYQLKHTPEITPETIEIYGDSQVISQIDKIYTDSIVISDLRDSVSQMVKLQMPGNIRMSTASVRATWEAEQFTDKSFVLPIRVKDLPSTESMHLFPNEVTLVVRVGISHFALVTEEDFNVYCLYPNNQQKTLPVIVETNNPYITKMRTNVRDVEYIIER